MCEKFKKALHFKQIQQRCRDFLPQDRNQYLLLLLSQLAIVLIAPQMDLSRIEQQIVLHLLFFSTVIACMYAIKKEPVRFWSSVLASIGIIVADCLAIFYRIGAAQYFAKSLLGFLYFIIIATVINDIISAQKITKNTIYGAFSGFMLLASFFGAIYEILYRFDKKSFSFGKILADGELAWFDLLYFSYVTQTSIGYGDIVATTTLARSFVVIQGICGTFYLATVVAHIVSGIRQNDDRAIEEKIMTAVAVNNSVLDKEIPSDTELLKNN